MKRGYAPIQYSLLSPDEAPLMFGVHHHRATQDHFDLRLECGSFAHSWVLPEGPSLYPKHVREAIRVKDHAKKCLGTEGRIPTGFRGAGPILLWDKGTYLPSLASNSSPEESIELGLQQGCLHLTFRGEKLLGAWLLVRRRTGWLFQKLRDAHASDLDVLRLDRSVLTGRQIGDL
ncbi:MAG: hypothetical protein BGO01_20125 [Armatimonadetes bacterium 55-13]|nr:hypothetical protein [Armatimonadota bacterium]OJU64420.1 MAG: hypothetical protein BGO01_20125 [Armatimonadetes bacterium 55-13]